MRLLVLSPRMPCTNGKADSINVYNLIVYLARQGHQIHLVTFAPQAPYEWENVDELEQLCETVETAQLSPSVSKMKIAWHIFSGRPLQVSYYYYRTFQKIVDRATNRFKPDCVYAHLIRMAEYGKSLAVPKLLGMINCQALNYRRLVQHDASWLRRMMYSIEYRKVKKYEPLAAKLFDQVTLVSKYDRAVMDPENQLDCQLCPCGIDVEYFSTDLGLTRIPYSMVMHGDFGTPTNIQAASYFVREIYPLIKARINHCSVTFAGRASDTQLRALAGEGITLTGRVDDIRPYLQRAQIAINPMKIAAGQQNKTLTSMASGLPVVSTSVANEGIQAVDNQELLIGDTPQEFMEQVIRLMQDRRLADSLISNGMRFVSKNWNLQIHHQKLERILLTLSQQSGRQNGLV